jgi:hypothetical protein
MNGSIITKDMIDGAADRLKDGSIRLYLGNHQQDEAGGYTGKDQAITLRMVGPRAATTMTGLKCLLIHEIVHAAHHIAGKPMSNYTDEGLAFAVEAVVRLSFKLPLDQVCSAALGLIGSGGLGDPVADLNRALSEARYRDYAKKYHVTRFRRKKA